MGGMPSVSGSSSSSAQSGVSSGAITFGAVNIAPKTNWTMIGLAAAGAVAAIFFLRK